MRLIQYSIFIFFQCLALQSKSQVSYGLLTGFTHSTFRIMTPAQQTDETCNRSYTSNFMAGINARMPLSKNLFFQPGLSILGAGANLSHQGLIQGVYDKELVFVAYLNVSANAVYQLNIKSEWKPFVGAGAYASRALNGSQTGTGVSNQDTSMISNRLQIAKNGIAGQTIPLTIKPMDYGCNLLTGVQFKDFQLMFSYSLGMVNLVSTAAPAQYNYRNRVFALSLGYFHKI